MFAIIMLMFTPAHAEEGWFPFVLDKMNPGSPLNIGKLVLDAPAGKHGFVKVKNGHFYFEDGTRAKFWGVNLVEDACFPSHNVAEKLASRLSQFGFNAVRFHNMDANFSPKGIFQDTNEQERNPQLKNTRTLDPAQLEKMDYFIYQLKKHGIYVDLNLMVGRNFTEADGVPEANALNLKSRKLVSLFDPQIVNLQQEYINNLLNHYNPYTKSLLKDEPAIAIVEIINETSLYRTWVYGELDKGGILPASYEKELDSRWNQWLQRKYSSNAQLTTAWTELGKIGLNKNEDLFTNTVERIPFDQIERYSDVRAQDTFEFYLDLDDKYFSSMRDFINQFYDKSRPLVGTNIFFDMMSLITQDKTMNTIDFHSYWDHPEFSKSPEGQELYKIHNQSMLDEPIHNIIQFASYFQIKNKPFMISEWNFCYPNDYAYEGPPIMASYGSFLDWDGMFIFAYRHYLDNINRSNISGNFDIDSDPQKMILSSVFGYAYLNNLIKPSRQEFEKHYSIIDTLRMTNKWGLIKRPRDINGTILSPLEDKIVTSLQDNLHDQENPKVDFSNIYRDYLTNTKEIAWKAGNKGKGYVTINSPYIQGAAGKIAKIAVELDNITFKTDKDCSLFLVSLDKQPIEYSSEMLLVIAGRVKNADEKINNSTANQFRPHKRKGPALLEPIKARIVLRSADLNNFIIQKLDSKGAAMMKLRTRQTSFGLEIGMNSNTTAWYKIERNVDKN